uniref:ST8 alpha-N-acetyl-neuraminide alpha-2,8-sialyltransferase 6 n=1 Tax=Terrapene triunguis TaxID=2587831 RepID=A0A674JNQ8_9SAUR
MGEFWGGWMEAPPRECLLSVVNPSASFPALRPRGWTQSSAGNTTYTDYRQVSDSVSLRPRLDEAWIWRRLKLVQSCPWAHNAGALGRYRYPPPPPYRPQLPAVPQTPSPPPCHPSLPRREQLGHCCNASADLVLTRDNTPLGSRIVCDGQPAKKLLVQEALLEILPQGSPFQGAPYDSCAVVGNGGILHNSGCGPEIDRAQFVIRFNLPPMGFSEHVGTKSSVITVNPSILVLRYRGLSRWRRPFVEAMGTYGAPLLLIPAFSFIGFTAVSSQALYTLEDFGSLARAVFMNPEYLAGLDGHWHRRGLRAKRLSSGFMLVNAALELCQHLTLYGFWPFPTDPEGRPLSHHYYDNQPSKPGVHAMPDEFTRYLGMHLQGALRLHLGRCQEGPAGGRAQQGSEGGV